MLKRILAIFILLLGLAGCTPLIASGQTPRGNQRVFTDMAGRNVIVPKKITRVLGMSPVGTILIYTLSPELLAGWNYQQDPGEVALIAEPYRHLPMLGGWYGKNNTGNMEEIIKAHPDVMISMGDAMGTTVAERVQEQTHIPVVVLDGDLKKLPETYMKAAELMGNQARATMLAAECRKTIEEIESKVSAIPAAKRRRVYYAEGPSGLETEPGNSMHSEALNFAGAVNVAAVPNQQGYGHTPVSMEQVLQWNPDVLISGYDHDTSPGHFYSKVWTDPAWMRIAAVRNREVYETPQYPFCWIDRPPSVNRIIGIKWLANLFYPEIFHYDLRKETREFYKTFYHVQLSETQLDQILLTAVKKSAAPKTH
jgi:iron complex transport system substrate-binding protein